MGLIAWCGSLLALKTGFKMAVKRALIDERIAIDRCNNGLQNAGYLCPRLTVKRLKAVVVFR
jgi:hypothetical protein